jgi:hypothetical protein
MRSSDFGNSVCMVNRDARERGQSSAVYRLKTEGAGESRHLVHII